jgi:hypothetical protein
MHQPTGLMARRNGFAVLFSCLFLSIASAEPQEVSIGYYIGFSTSSLPSAPRLIAAVHHPDNYYVVHVDAKDKGSPDAISLANWVANNPKYAANVKFLPSQLVAYRGVSMVLVTLEAIGFLLRWSSNWSYFINISGADYPLLTQSEMRSILGKATQNNKGRNMSFLGFWGRHPWDFHPCLDPTLAGVANVSLSQLWSSGRYPYQPTFRVGRGSAWMILSRPFAQHVSDSDASRRVLLLMANVPSSAEVFFLTMAANAEPADHAFINHNMRSVLWWHRGVHVGQHPRWVGPYREGLGLGCGHTRSQGICR